MRTMLVAVLILSAGVGTAAAQDDPRFYAGGVLALSRTEADLVSGTTPMAGGVVGVHLTPGFGVEAEVTRGFQTLVRDFGTDSRLESRQTASVGVFAVWRSRASTRVRAAGYTGLTLGFHEDVSAGILGRSTRSEQAVGATGGFMVPVTVAGRVSIAPDVRFTFSVLRDEPAFTIAGGVRVLWGF